MAHLLRLLGLFPADALFADRKEQVRVVAYAGRALQPVHVGLS
jgi:hypothetical protein